MTSQDSTAFGEAGTAKYVQLTTYRKDGTPVSSPVWAVLDGDRLLVWSETEAWKVKRLKRNPKVVVQATDARGKKLSGEPVSGTGVVLDAEGTRHVRKKLAEKYGLLARVLLFSSKIRRGESGTIGIAITAA
ncbi:MULTISPECIES: PPOX class F420-dependent oxidoreductase [Gordonia]|uniref:PPOX class F420-dependent oxidoreductase n=1 Tax=Gordonia amicalis TaxID=89053 RepID=A0AAE4R1Y2_9ACTN|nr:MULTISPECIES: PPOX class F420-dependent oxidoreductase [Gordonia]ATD72233.1 PPOX class F420-dependent enzyme [Gordonia sp. 1D]MCR8895925.1 PPOX class F420-dependent oxidoreductase [Gordonia sp. GONU]MCZ4578680.1 PPOX class F420-dependent oxidoreductase [Gordonia amicalis]MDJ0452516.1 PPOX class F420-dependent oxidoreductase [Gordonia amicalis]MDV6309618.1 PPOX class F420-dependent oxidoreductase [Gordonia amicalis]